MFSAVSRPLTPAQRMNPRWGNGRRTADVAASFIKPNDRLTSFDRLEIYNRQYWFRLLDCLYDDFPGLRAVIGEKKFTAMSETYLTRYPSSSFTLRNLGSRLEKFLREEPRWARPRTALALDMVRFEWAKIIAFDGGARPIVTIDDLLGRDPSRLRLKLQPYVTPLELGYPLDDFSIALRQRDDDGPQAGNAASTGRASKSGRTVRLPRPERVYLAVHRLENVVYYKRLDASAYAVLCALRGGATLAKASERANDAESLRRWFEMWMKLGWFCR